MWQAAPNVEEIFFAALELESPAARSAFLDRVCGDPELRQRVERLLAHDAQVGDFLAAPALMPTATTVPDSSRSGIEEPGTVIGPYKLLEVIGEGGMGTVYMAEQSHPIRRRVALKVIKPGMDSKQIVARFEAERQALAMMDHPNIATVLDAGMTTSGRPYFVMELVRGLPITEYCDQQQLTIPERLDLFVLVCRGVQHAHHKGIIHRDLKPSNVLVTVVDGAAVPKVIDFGVAKATGPALTDKTLFTGFHHFVGTPLYVSPEQADQTGIDVDTRSDIYSLGVLLYELVTGTTPFDPAMLKRAAFDEIRRMIREEEPPRPSTRLDTTEEIPSIAANRNIEPRKLSGLVRGELDWIVMKAMEKDRNRRYETANSLAADLRRYLDDEPVLAGPPSATYRFRKFARRHRAAVLASAAIVALLVVGVAGTSWGLWRSVIKGREKARALKEAETHFARSREIVDRMLTRVGQNLLDDVPGMEPVRREILEDALAYYREFLRVQAKDPALTVEAARAHQRYGTILKQLGRSAEAIPAFDEALAILERLGPNADATTPRLDALVETHLHRANALGWGEDEALKDLGRAREIARRLATKFPSRPTARHLWWHTQVSYAQCLATIDRPRALALIEETLAGGDDTNPEDRPYRMFALATASGLLADLGRRAEAAEALDRAVATAEVLAEARHDRSSRASLADYLIQRADLTTTIGRPDAAIEDARRGVTLFEGLAQDFPNTTGYRAALGAARMELARALAACQRPDEAEAMLRRLLDDLGTPADGGPPAGRSGGPVAFDLLLVGLSMGAGPVVESPPLVAGLGGHLDTANSFLKRAVLAHYELGLLLARQGRDAEAEAQFGRIHALLGEAAERTEDDEAASIAVALAYANAAFGFERASRPRDAEACNRRAIEMMEQAIVTVSSSITLREKLASEHFRRGRVLGGLGRDRESAAAYRTAAGLYETLADAGTDRREAFRFARAACLNNVAWSLAKPAAATLADAEEAVRMSRLAVALAPKNGDFRNTLGIALYRSGDLQGAVEALTASMRMRKGGDAADWFPLAMARRRLGDQAEARRLHGLAVDWMSRHAPNDPDLRGLRAEAETLIGAGDSAQPDVPAPAESTPIGARDSPDAPPSAP
jgi:serine/threonine protein kinase